MEQRWQQKRTAVNRTKHCTQSSEVFVSYFYKWHFEFRQELFTVQAACNVSVQCYQNLVFRNAWDTWVQIKVNCESPDLCGLTWAFPDFFLQAFFRGVGSCAAEGLWPSEVTHWVSHSARSFSDTFWKLNYTAEMVTICIRS